MHRSLPAQQTSLGRRSGPHVHRASKTKPTPAPGGEGSAARLTEGSGHCAPPRPRLGSRRVSLLQPCAPPSARQPWIRIPGAPHLGCRRRRLSGGAAGPAGWCFSLPPPKSCVTCRLGTFPVVCPRQVQVSPRISLLQALSSQSPILTAPLVSPTFPPTPDPGRGGRANPAPLALTRGRSGSERGGATPPGTRNSQRT